MGSFYTKGCHAVTPPTRMVPSILDARIKNRSRLFYTLAEIEAKLVDPDAQSVILDIHGNVAENKGGNIFMIKDGKLITPTTANCLEGLTRNSTMEIARSLDIEVIEAVIQSYDLATADEMFITSTPYSIMPATKFNGMPIADGNVGPITKKLIQGWSDRVGSISLSKLKSHYINIKMKTQRNQMEFGELFFYQLIIIKLTGLHLKNKFIFYVTQSFCIYTNGTLQNVIIKQNKNLINYRK